MGRIHSFESFGTVDGPGIRCVIFLQGCPMRCLYCHNPDTWNYAGGKEVSAQELADKVLKYKSYFGEKGGVTVSGGEPLLQLDFLLELFTILKKKNIHTCIDTSGAVFDKENLVQAKKLEKLLALTDLFLLDIKHIDEKEHKKLTGKSNQNILAFAKYLDEHKKSMWIRHVLVPTITDNDSFLLQLKKFIDTLSYVEKVEVLPYHTMGKVKYKELGIDYPLEGIDPPTKERVENAKKILIGEK